MQHRSTQIGELQHLVIRNLTQFARTFHNPRICRVNSINVSVDFTYIGIDSRCECNCRCIGTSPAKRRNLAIFRHSLESGYHNDRSIIERFLHFVRANVRNASFPEYRLGPEARLPTCIGNSLSSNGMKRDGQHGD
ncbi:hypothetical protein D3C85_1466940 [compost metagenome]